jgi:hypothetical protein
MRNIINLINVMLESKDTKIKPTDFNFIPDLNKSIDKPIDKTKETIPGKKAKNRNPRIIKLDTETEKRAARHLNSLFNSDIDDKISDEEASRISDFGIPEPHDITNLPAVISKEIKKYGDDIVEPEWSQIKNLPGYLQNPIRALGRQVFRQFTNTPIEDIQMIGTIGGLNSNNDVIGMMNWIKRHGVRDDSANIDFSQVMPGYRADVSLWKTADYSFLLVKDFGGYYIYAWVGGRGVHVDKPKETKRLK